MTEAETVVFKAIDAIDRRDEALFATLAHPDAQFVWPDSLRAKNFTRAGRACETWEELWAPFQPCEQFPTRGLEPRIIASDGNHVVALWQQRGMNAKGERFHCEVLGLYEVNDGLLFRGKMYYFDTLATERFLRSGDTDSVPAASQ